jgi:hypothetical protein
MKSKFTYEDPHGNTFIIITDAIDDAETFAHNCRQLGLAAGFHPESIDEAWNQSHLNKCGWCGIRDGITRMCTSNQDQICNCCDFCSGVCLAMEPDA